MVDGQPGPEAAHLDTLAARLFGWLTLLGGGVLLLMLAGVLQLPRISADGRSGFALPGTAGRHMIEPIVVPILAGCGGLLCALGLLSFWLSRRGRSRPPSRRLRAAALLPRRSLVVLIGGLTLLAIALLRR